MKPTDPWKSSQKTSKLKKTPQKQHGNMVSCSIKLIAKIQTHWCGPPIHVLLTWQQTFTTRTTAEEVNHCIMHHRPDVMKRRGAGHTAQYAVWIATHWLVSNGYLGDLLLLKRSVAGVSCAPNSCQDCAVTKWVRRIVHADSGKTAYTESPPAHWASQRVCCAGTHLRIAGCRKACVGWRTSQASALIYHNLGSSGFVTQELLLRRDPRFSMRHKT